MFPDNDLGTLSVEVGAGVAFRVSDGAGKEVGRGTGRWSEPCAPGLYAVQWLSATDSHETLVRVNAGMTATAVYSPSTTDPSDLGVAAALSEAPKIAHELRPNSSRSAASIAIVLVSGREVHDADILRDLRLFDTRATEISGTNNQLVGLGAEGRDTARTFAVHPGCYLLSYRAMTGETLQQTVPALRGRQTMIFMEAAKGDVLLAEDDGFARVNRAGINPAHTVMISLGGTEAELRIHERLRLTRLLLRDLATGSASLTRDFVAILDHPETDPLLKLAGALVVLAHSESRTSPSIDDPWEKSNSPEVPHHEWLSRAAKWLHALRGAKLPPDVAIAWWQLKQLRYDGRFDKISSSINIPPMYSCSWRWAAARSADDPGAIRRHAAVRAAARSQNSAGPWLSWKAAAGKAAPSSAFSGKAGRIDALAQSVAEKSRRLIGEASNPRAIAELIARAGPEAGEVAMLVNMIAQSVSSQVSLPSALASALSVPARTLHRYLASTNQQLDSVLRDQSVMDQFARNKVLSLEALPVQSVGTPTHLPGDERGAPGLKRRVEDPDDPQKGRFGGLASRQGYSAQAEFTETTSRSWTRIMMLVEGPTFDGDEVLFYLHDSFPKAVRRAYFQRGTARTTVTAWGGFTVGIWLPHQQVELELDLAVLPNAPKMIRTR